MDNFEKIASNAFYTELNRLGVDIGADKLEKIAMNGALIKSGLSGFKSLLKGGLGKIKGMLPKKPMPLPKSLPKSKPFLPTPTGGAIPKTLGPSMPKVHTKTPEFKVPNSTKVPTAPTGGTIPTGAPKYSAGASSPIGANPKITTGSAAQTAAGQTVAQGGQIAAKPMIGQDIANKIKGYGLNPYMVAGGAGLGVGSLMTGRGTTVKRYG